MVSGEHLIRAFSTKDDAILHLELQQTLFDKLTEDRRVDTQTAIYDEIQRLKKEVRDVRI